jgi:hypothetical protein
MGHFPSAAELGQLEGPQPAAGECQMDFMSDNPEAEAAQGIRICDRCTTNETATRIEGDRGIVSVLGGICTKYA